MIRRVYSGVAILMLLCWMIAAGLWVRSYWVESLGERARRDLTDGTCLEGVHRVFSRRGRIYFVTESGSAPKDVARWTSITFRPRGGQVGTEWFFQETRPPYKSGPRSRWGFSYLVTSSGFPHANGPVSTRTMVLGCPWGVVMAVLGIVPLWWLAGVRRELWRRKRVRSGLCVQCGYDLRATPGRCPECGETAPFSSAGELTHPEPTGNLPGNHGRRPSVGL